MTAEVPDVVCAAGVVLPGVADRACADRAAAVALVRQSNPQVHALTLYAVDEQG